MHDIFVPQQLSANFRGFFYYYYIDIGYLTVHAKFLDFTFKITFVII